MVSVPPSEGIVPFPPVAVLLVLEVFELNVLYNLPSNVSDALGTRDDPSSEVTLPIPPCALLPDLGVTELYVLTELSVLFTAPSNFFDIFGTSGDSLTRDVTVRDRILVNVVVKWRDA